MQQLETIKQKEAFHKPKKNKAKHWILTFTLTTKIAPIRDITWKNKYATRKAALQGLESLQKGQGMFSKRYWELTKWEITER